MKKWDKPHGFSWLGKIQSTLPNAKIAPSSSQDRKGHCLWVCSKNRQLDEAFFISMHCVHIQAKSFKPVYPPISLWVRPIPEVANDNAETMEEGRPSDLLSFLSQSNKTSKASISWFLKTETTCMCLRAIKLRGVWLGFKGSFCGTKNMKKFHSAQLLSIRTSLKPATI